LRISSDRSGLPSEVVIRSEGLGKKYVIGHRRQASGYRTLRETAVIGAKGFWRKTKTLATGSAIVAGDTFEDFWALRDVSFDINRGESVGIIGRNGAGKSTLLKIFSRITEPSAGRVTIKGRVASLLEVGTGFHPELTGRENIYLNGTILGMTRKEIRRKFDEIAAFAEVEKFLDTPVKRYSSGMYVRLAFAVAAHLEPEILVVDEVLAVGDAAFQKKCLGKMGDVARAGRTVLFVSHNMGAVAQLCSKAILLEGGEVSAYSKNVSQVIGQYLSGGAESRAMEWSRHDERFDNDWLVPTRFYVGYPDGRVSVDGRVGVDEEAFIYVEADCARADPALQVGVGVYDSGGSLIYWSFSTDIEDGWVDMHPGRVVLRLCMPAFFLNEGSYRVDLGIALFHRQWLCEPGRDVPSITIEVAGGFISSRYWTEKRPGILAPALTWEKVR
jgi:lipopolysaccharide transport system ATP-binding protein